MNNKTIFISKKELNEIVQKTIDKYLKEGVSYNNQNDTFEFNFQTDNETDIIKLRQIGNIIDSFNKTYIYGYEFLPDIPSKIKTKFIHSIKFPENNQNEQEIKEMIKNAVFFLDKGINLAQYNTIILPQSLSELNTLTLKLITRFTSANLTTIELIKELPANIEFDYYKFHYEVLDTTVNGRPRYTEAQKQQVLQSIEQMMEDIHKSDYFSIARNVKKQKYRKYIKNYYKFKDEQSKQLFEQLTNSNILILDDIVTSGTTIFHMLNTLRSINDTNNIVVFSLLGTSKVL